MLLDEPLGLIVERLRRRGTDDASVEVKACTNKLSADVWETVSAFANTAGGLIILGLNEAEGFVPSANFASIGCAISLFRVSETEAQRQW